MSRAAPPTILVRPGPLLSSTVRTWRLKSERRVGGDGAIDVRRLERQRQPRNYSANNGKVNQQRRRPPSHARRYASTAPAPLRLSLPNRLSGSQSHRTQLKLKKGREGGTEKALDCTCAALTACSEEFYGCRSRMYPHAQAPPERHIFLRSSLQVLQEICQGFQSNAVLPTQRCRPLKLKVRPVGHWPVGRGPVDRRGGGGGGVRRARAGLPVLQTIDSKGRRTAMTDPLPY